MPDDSTLGQRISAALEEEAKTFVKENFIDPTPGDYQMVLQAMFKGSLINAQLTLEQERKEFATRFPELCRA